MKNFTIITMMLLATACAVPKVMVDHAFLGKDRTSKALIQRTGSTMGSTKSKGELFNLHMEVCSLDSNHKESRCKDTLVLENVVPRSIY